MFRQFISRVGREVPEKTMKDLRASCAESEDELPSIHLSKVIADICNSQIPDMETFKVVGMTLLLHYNIHFNHVDINILYLFHL